MARTSKLIAALLSCALMSVVGVARVRGSDDTPGRSPDEALQRLQEGNQRFVTGSPTHPNTDETRRVETVKGGEHPAACILGCSDSRAPLERIFDQGVGDVFVVRVAGNVADTDEIGSIECGIVHLCTPLLIVLGHSQCGAVTAVVQSADVSGRVLPLRSKIKPAVAKTRAAFPQAEGDELLARAIRANVWQGIENVMTKSPEARALAKEGKLKIIGAVYDLESGKIEWLGAHPEREKRLACTGGPDAMIETPPTILAAASGIAVESEPQPAQPAATAKHDSPASSGKLALLPRVAAPTVNVVAVEPVTLVPAASSRSLTARGSARSRWRKRSWLRADRVYPIRGSS